MTTRRECCPVCNASTIVRADGRFRKHKRILKGQFHMVPCNGDEQFAPVVDLMAALQASIEQARTARQRRSDNAEGPAKPPSIT